jgi:hypothetical protein
VWHPRPSLSPRTYKTFLRGDHHVPLLVHHQIDAMWYGENHIASPEGRYMAVFISPFPEEEKNRQLSVWLVARRTEGGVRCANFLSQWRRSVRPGCSRATRFSQRIFLPNSCWRHHRWRAGTWTWVGRCTCGGGWVPPAMVYAIYHIWLDWART